MARLSTAHMEVGPAGAGRCSVPMWQNGCPADFCDDPAYGRQEPGQRRYGRWSDEWGKWFDGYCSGLACYAHGGPKAPESAR